VTAEFMIGLPVMVGVTTALIMGATAGLTHQRLAHYAADYARVLSSGGDPSGLDAPAPVVRVALDERDQMICVEVTVVQDGGLWSLAPLALTQRSCALAPPSW